jgi:ATP-dependent DNA ligase
LVAQRLGPPGALPVNPGGPANAFSFLVSAGLSSRLMVEVCYDHFTGERFRHGTRLLRWRPDKAPKQCTMDQIKQKKAKLMTLLD